MPWQRRIVVAPDELATATATRLATSIDEAVAARGVCHLALSGGRTPWDSFAELATMSLPWPQLHLWQVDERIAPDDDPARNSIGIHRTLIDPLSLSDDQVHLMEVTAPDVEAAAASYAAELITVCRGVLDVVHLGLGPDGHTASWVPGDPVIDAPEDVAVTTTEYQGRRRMTMTPPCVNRARSRLLELKGSEKADALARVLDGDPAMPASRLSPMTTILDATQTSMAAS
jgi:6-phosphogluconolactonase